MEDVRRPIPVRLRGSTIEWLDGLRTVGESRSDLIRALIHDGARAREGARIPAAGCVHQRGLSEVEWREHLRLQEFLGKCHSPEGEGGGLFELPPSLHGYRFVVYAFPDPDLEVP